MEEWKTVKTSSTEYFFYLAEQSALRQETPYPHQTLPLWTLPVWPAGKTHTWDTFYQSTWLSLVCIHLHMSRVLVGAAGVGDDVEVALVRLCHYEVINNPSFLGGEEGQRTLKGGGAGRGKRKVNVFLVLVEFLRLLRYTIVLFTLNTCLKWSHRKGSIFCVFISF